MAPGEEIPFKEGLNYIKEDTSKSSGKSRGRYNLNKARQEEEDWEKRRKILDGEHGYRLEKTFFRIARMIIWLLAILLGIVLIIWFLHLVLPCQWRWLQKDEVQSLERILFASTLLSLAGRYFSKYKILTRK